MQRRMLAAVCLSALLAGCSTLDALNPFASSGPKMAELQPIQASAEVRVLWNNTVGKAEELTFVPAVVDASVYAGSSGRHGRPLRRWPASLADQARTAAFGWRRRR
jgi:outer membrane protein assembly factor BamB